MVSRDDRKRNKTLRRRLPVLLKKAGELRVLCGVPACLVAYCPGEAEPVVWPSPAVAAHVVRRYRQQANVPSLKNELGGKEFLVQKNDKVRAQLSKVQLQRREEEIKLVIADTIAGRRGSFEDLSPDFLVSVEFRVQSKLKAINARLQEIRSGANTRLQEIRSGAAQALLPHNVQMVESLPMVETPVPQTPMMLEPPPLHHDGSCLLETFDPFNDAGHGCSLLSTEEMRAVLLDAGIFSPFLPNASFDP